MKLNKEIVIALIIMIVTSALYRVLPGRPFGFAPQIAIALFSGSLFVKNKHFAFLLPLVSMFLSDLMYQGLYVNHLSPIQGFYDGQWQNYLLIAALAIFGFGLQTNRVSKFVGNFIAAPTVYFLVSNFMVWASFGGYQRPLTASGLMQTMVDGLPFYGYSLAGTFVFGAVMFGGFKLIQPTLKAIKVKS
jgi:hypothetical protein